MCSQTQNGIIEVGSRYDTAYTASRAQARVCTRKRRKQIQKKSAGNAGLLRARERIVNVLCDLGRWQVGQAWKGGEGVEWREKKEQKTKKVTACGVCVNYCERAG